MNRKQRRKAPKHKGILSKIPVPRQSIDASAGRSTKHSVSSILMPHKIVAPQSAGHDDMDFLIHVAKMHHQAGRIREAEEIYNNILSLNPKHADSLHLLGLVRHQLGFINEALKLISKALLIRPKDAETHNNMGNVLRRLGRTNEAIRSFGKAIKLSPDFAGAHSNLALTYRQLGQFEKAAKYYRLAIKRDPLQAEAWSGLAGVGRLVLQRNEVESAEKVLANEGLPNSARRHICYALGKHFDTMQDWGRAFHYYRSANELGDVSLTCGSIKGIFEKMVNEPLDFLNHLVLSRNVTPLPVTPIFVVGMPRSGTTLVDQILISHPDVDSGGELNLIDAMMREVFKEIQSEDKPLSDLLSADKLQKIGQKFATHIKDKVEQNGKMPSHYVDKSLLNIAFVPIILKLLPESRIVYCSRSPLDTCLSIYFTDFRLAYDYTTSLSDIGEMYCTSLNVINRWDATYRGSILKIQYEDILDHQERETKRLLEFCGLSWNSDCLSFFQTNRQISTPSDWQVRQPIFSSSRDRWKNYEPYLENLKEALRPCI